MRIRVGVSQAWPRRSSCGVRPSNDQAERGGGGSIAGLLFRQYRVREEDVYLSLDAHGRRCYVNKRRSSRSNALRGHPRSTLRLERAAVDRAGRPRGCSRRPSTHGSCASTSRARAATAASSTCGWTWTTSPASGRRGAAICLVEATQFTRDGDQVSSIDRPSAPSAGKEVGRRRLERATRSSRFACTCRARSRISFQHGRERPGAATSSCGNSRWPIACAWRATALYDANGGNGMEAFGWKP